jgi:hypothetical protein
MALVCGICEAEIPEGGERKIPVPKEHFAYGFGASLTVCEACQKQSWSEGEKVLKREAAKRTRIC